MIRKKSKSLLILCVIGTSLTLQGVYYTTQASQVTAMATESRVLLSNTSQNETGLVTASVLNVRDDSSSTSEVIGSLAKGTKVDVVYRESNGWYMVKFGGRYAYVSGDYLTITDSTSLPVIQTGKVTASKLNVRSGSSTSSEIIGTLKRGDVAEIVEVENGWYKIRFYNSYGYINASYVK